ncbi:MAG: ATP-binding protein, partial [Rubrivivax sp.]
KGLSLRVEVAGDRGEGGEACESGAGSDVVAHADRRALHQIVLNLGSNAVKFTPQGEVLLQASLVHRAAGPPSVEIAVVDTGVGISAEDQARLFQAFTQLGPRSGRPAEGTGLGLHLSRKLADLMQGTLRVTSEPGRGSRFVLTLAPAQPGAAAGSA